MKFLNIYCFTSHVFSLCLRKRGVRIFLAESVFILGILRQTGCFAYVCNSFHFDLLSYYPTNRLPEDYGRRGVLIYGKEHTIGALDLRSPMIWPPLPRL